MSTIDEQIEDTKAELNKLEFIKQKHENSLIVHVMKIFAESGCCDWTDQNIHRLTFKEDNFNFGDGVRIGFPSKWSLFEITYDLHKAGLKVEQISWGRDENFMLVGVGD
ncbi:MAG TPA: hypothetical protein ENI23_11325 [bacterium]|nr:hypothetical protein [bacterium]